MTAPDPIDLDHLDALYVAATPGDWRRVYVYNISNSVGWVARVDAGEPTADCIVALYNAWPAVSAELRRLRAENEKLRAERDGAVRHALSTLDKQGDDDGN